MGSIARQQVSFIAYYLKINPKTFKMGLRVLTFLFYILLGSGHVSHSPINHPSDLIIVGSEYVEVAVCLNNEHSVSNEYKEDLSDLNNIPGISNGYKEDVCYLNDVPDISNKYEEILFYPGNEIAIVCLHRNHTNIFYIKRKAPLNIYLLRGKRVENLSKKFKENKWLLKENYQLYKIACHQHIIKEYRIKYKRSSTLITHNFLII
ncbi:hypothetical protein [Chitinophaga sp.]|uniref:hypothetical protein n=1 Tax=Chitinophaga sp. TaxID=1869181 RepID=UPI002F94C710